jgi:hypothetical protein
LDVDLASRTGGMNKFCIPNVDPYMKRLLAFNLKVNEVCGAEVDY